MATSDCDNPKSSRQSLKNIQVKASRLQVERCNSEVTKAEADSEGKAAAAAAVSINGKNGKLFVDALRAATSGQKSVRSTHHDVAPASTDTVGLLAVQADNDDSSSRQGLGRQPAASVGPSLSHGHGGPSHIATGSECQWPGPRLQVGSESPVPRSVTRTGHWHRDLLVASPGPGPTDTVQVGLLAVHARHDDSSSRQGLGRQPTASVGPSQSEKGKLSTSTRALATTTQAARGAPTQPSESPLARSPALQPVLAAAAPSGPSQSEQDVECDSGSESGSVREVAGAKLTLKNGKRSTSTRAKAPGVPVPVSVASFQPDLIVSTASRAIEVLKPFSRIENAQRSLNSAKRSAKAMVDLLSAHYDCEGPDADSNRDRFQLVPIEPAHIEMLIECISDLNAHLKAFSDLNTDETTIEFVDSSKYFQVLTRWLEKLDTTRLKLPTYLPVDKTLVVSSALEAINVAIDEDSLKQLWTNTVHLVLYIDVLF